MHALVCYIFIGTTNEVTKSHGRKTAIHIAGSTVRPYEGSSLTTAETRMCRDKTVIQWWRPLTIVSYIYIQITYISDFHYCLVYLSFLKIIS